MNRQILNDLEKKFPGFKKSTHCMWVDVKDIIMDVANSQIRKNGKVASKVPGMVTDIKEHGQKVPVSVRRLPNGKFELKDGITRYEAVKVIGGKILVSLYHDTIFSKMPNPNDEWTLFQARCNDHEPSTPNTAQDIKYQINKWYVDGVLERKVGFKHSADPRRWIKKATDFLKSDIYTRSAFSRDSLRNAVKGIINKSAPVGNRYENYTKPEAFELYSTVNSVGWSGTAGSIVAGYCVYAVNSTGDEKDLMGNAWRKSGTNPSAKFDVIAWVGDLSDKDDDGITAARQKIYDMYTRGVNHPKFGRMLNNIYFLPQIKNGPNSENMARIYSPKELGVREQELSNLSLVI